MKWVIVIKERIEYFKSRHHSYEAKQLSDALAAINSLVPPLSFSESPEPQEELWGEVENEIANVVYRKPAGSTHITPIIEVLKSKFTLTHKQNTP